METRSQRPEVLLISVLDFLKYHAICEITSRCRSYSPCGVDESSDESIIRLNVVTPMNGMQRWLQVQLRSLHYLNSILRNASYPRRLESWQIRNQQHVHKSFDCSYGNAHAVSFMQSFSIIKSKTGAGIHHPKHVTNALVKVSVPVIPYQLPESAVLF